MDHGRKREEEAVQARRMWAKDALPLEQFLEDGLDVGEIGPFGLQRGHVSGIGRARLAHFREPGVVAAAIVSTVLGRRACDGGRGVRQIVPQHGDEAVRDLLTEPAVEWQLLEH